MSLTLYNRRKKRECGKVRIQVGLVGDKVKMLHFYYQCQTKVKWHMRMSFCVYTQGAWLLRVHRLCVVHVTCMACAYHIRVPFNFLSDLYCIRAYTGGHSVNASCTRN